MRQRWVHKTRHERPGTICCLRELNKEVFGFQEAEVNTLVKYIQKNKQILGIMVHVCNPRIHEARTGRWQVQGQLGPYEETLAQEREGRDGQKERKGEKRRGRERNRRTLSCDGNCEL